MKHITHARAKCTRTRNYEHQNGRKYPSVLVVSLLGMPRKSTIVLKARIRS